MTRKAALSPIIPSPSTSLRFAQGELREESPTQVTTSIGDSSVAALPQNDILTARCASCTCDNLRARPGGTAAEAHPHGDAVAPGTAAAETAADVLLRGAAGVYTARQLRDKARRETPTSALGSNGEHALDAEDWLTLYRLRELPARFRLDILYDRLDDSERRVIIRSLDGARQVEIAAELGMSQPRVSRILARAVIKCRDSCALYEGSPLEGEFWSLVREVEKAIYRRPERVWRHQRPLDRALVSSLRDKGRRFLFFVNL